MVGKFSVIFKHESALDIAFRSVFDEIPKIVVF